MALCPQSSSSEPALEASLAPCALSIGRNDDALRSQHLTTLSLVWCVRHLMHSAIPGMHNQRARLKLEKLLFINEFRCRSRGFLRSTSAGSMKSWPESMLSRMIW
eukprot:6380980-Amphidinium_carterae.1